MQPETKQSVDDLRSSLRSRKAAANGAFQRFKIQELVNDLPSVELIAEWLTPPATPTVVKPRIR